MICCSQVAGIQKSSAVLERAIDPNMEVKNHGFEYFVLTLEDRLSRSEVRDILPTAQGISSMALYHNIS